MKVNSRIMVNVNNMNNKMIESIFKTVSDTKNVYYKNDYYANRINGIRTKKLNGNVKIIE